MKIKLDENVPNRVAALFKDHDLDTATVSQEGLTGSDDGAIFEAAKREDRIIVTLDVGFADIRRYPPGEHSGIVVVRLPNQQPSLVEATLRSLLTEYDLEAMTGCTVIAQPNVVRVRRPEPESWA